MTEITKLYELAGVEKKECGYCNIDTFCPYPHYKCNNECPFWKVDKVDYPPFTAEKQIELIKWLIKNTDFQTSTVSQGNQTEYMFCTGYDFCGNGFKSFENAIADIICEIWQDLTTDEQEQIREILK